MASYVLIDFDTTPPNLALYAPNYTTKDNDNLITLVADEALAEYQDIYIIDSKGRRREYTFSRVDEKVLEGNVRFSDYPMGFVTIYARLKDTADNISKIISHSIYIQETLDILRIEVQDVGMDIKLKTKEMQVNVNDEVMKIDIGSE